MSGVEDVINPPTANKEKTDEKDDTIDGKEEDKTSLTTNDTDCESANLMESTTELRTCLSKEEDNAPKVMIIKLYQEDY